MTAIITEFSYASAVEFLRDHQEKIEYDSARRRLWVNITGRPLQAIFVAAFDAILNKSPETELDKKIADIAAGYENGEPSNDPLSKDLAPECFGGFRWKLDQTVELIGFLRRSPESIDLMDISRDSFNVDRPEQLAQALLEAGLSNIRGISGVRVPNKS